MSGKWAEIMWFSYDAYVGHLVARFSPSGGESLKQTNTFVYDHTQIHKKLYPSIINGSFLSFRIWPCQDDYNVFSYS